MPMNSLKDAETRLADGAPLNEKDVRDLIPYLGAIGGGLIWRLFADLALQNIAAIQKFDKSSSKLSTRLLFLTWVISALTFVMTLATILTAIPVVRSLPHLRARCSHLSVTLSEQGCRILFLSKRANTPLPAHPLGGEVCAAPVSLTNYGRRGCAGEILPQR